MALALAAKGAKLALVDLNQAKLEETVQLCKNAGGDARLYIANVAKEDDVIRTFDQVVADFGALDGLVNNAGILRDGLLLKVLRRVPPGYGLAVNPGTDAPIFLPPGGVAALKADLAAP